MKKQVDKSHYDFYNYIPKRRLLSVWHQIDEVVKAQPERVLEVGPGPGLFKAMAGTLGIHVETLDMDADLKPDHVASVFDMPFKDGQFDVVCAFQMLEHLPFNRSLTALREFSRVASKTIIISVPDASRRFPVSVLLPKFGQVNFSVPELRLWSRTHRFDGEHYWEISKRGYPLSKVASTLSESALSKKTRSFRVPENPYHRFFVFQKVSI